MTATQVSKIVKRMKVIMTKAGLFRDKDMVTVVEMWEGRLIELREAVEKNRVANASTSSLRLISCFVTYGHCRTSKGVAERIGGARRLPDDSRRLG